MVKAAGLWRVLVWLVPLLARQWPRLVEARASANLVGDHDRERAAGRLREQYARGYLTVDELTRRIGRVVSARSRRDLSRALSGLAPERIAVRSASQPALRTAILVFSVGAYLVFTFTLLLLLGLVALIQGISTTELVAFLLVWLVPTYLLSRLWRRKPHF